MISIMHKKKKKKFICIMDRQTVTSSLYLAVVSTHVTVVSIASPTVWNSLPDKFRDPAFTDSFKQFLETILYSLCDQCIRGFLNVMCYINPHFIYLSWQHRDDKGCACTALKIYVCYCYVLGHISLLMLQFHARVNIWLWHFWCH